MSQSSRLGLVCYTWDVVNVALNFHPVRVNFRYFLANGHICNPVCVYVVIIKLCNSYILKALQI